MIRVWAVIERDLRRFRRSPTLIALSVLMPLVQLIILGHAFGGKVRNLPIGLVDHDHGVPAIELREMFQAIAANAQTFEVEEYVDQAEAMRDLREGRIRALLEIPPEFSRRLVAGTSPRLALVQDNTDQFSSSALQASLGGLVEAFNRENRDGEPPSSAAVSLSIVELYPYVPYIQFLLPGMISLSIFASAMIGGGIIFIDDKNRGLHEGYLVTPISKFELILGFNLAGVFKAIVSGTVILVVGSLIAGLPDPLNFLRLGRALLIVIVTALALISLMFLLVVRVSDPLLPRALFGVLNVLMFFPSGAVYPVDAFPGWMQAIAAVNPFTYAVHGFKTLLLRDAGLTAVLPDIAVLLLFAIVTMGTATLLFRRTL
jgi:ABC-2 type transport system permease protein